MNNITINGDNTVIAISQDPKVLDSLHQGIANVEKDPAIEGINISDNTTHKSIASISRKEFPYLKRPEIKSDEEPPRERVRPERVTLVIHSPVLAGKAKWKFIYHGTTISASMADESFRRRVQGREEQFGAGDRLDVALEISEKYDDETSTYIRTNKYVVRHVFDHFSPPKYKQKDLLDK